MMTITVCIGSGCHVKGSYRIIEILKTLVAQKGDQHPIELEACLCQGKCTQGVVVRFDDQVITHVTPDNIEGLFYQALNTPDEPSCKDDSRGAQRNESNRE